MAGLRVDYQLLDRIYASLGLAGQFKNIQAVQDSYNGVTGSGDITGARGIHLTGPASSEACLGKVRSGRVEPTTSSYDVQLPKLVRSRE